MTIDGFAADRRPISPRRRERSMIANESCAAVGREHRSDGSARRHPTDIGLRAVTALGTAAIAVIAAVVSYQHVHDVVRAHGESPLAAALIPLSVDGLILVSSLTLLADRRASRPRSALATTGLALGAIASLVANVAHAQPSVIGRLAAAWSPLALAISQELLLRRVDSADASGTRGLGAGADKDATLERTRSEVTPAAVTTGRDGTGMPRPGSKRAQLVAKVARLDPGDTRSDYQLARDLAPTIGLHEGTARRYLAELRRLSQRAKIAGPTPAIRPDGAGASGVPGPAS